MVPTVFDEQKNNGIYLHCWSVQNSGQSSALIAELSDIYILFFCIMPILSVNEVYILYH